MLKQRIITAFIIMFALVLMLFLLPPMILSFSLVCISTVAAWEWANLADIKSESLRIGYAVTIAAIIFFLVYYTHIGSDYVLVNVVRDIVGIGCTWWAISLIWVMSYPGSTLYWRHKSVKMLMGVLVLVPSTISLLYLCALPSNGHWVFLYVVGIVIAADVGAYFSGKTFGKAKLAPHVSPGRSWAGFWGGLLASILYALTVSMFDCDVVGLSSVSLVVVTAFAALASVLGDLLESMLKRERGIKDSSQLLPGHGGFMDRIDSITAAAPVFTLLSLLLQAAQ